MNTKKNSTSKIRAKIFATFVAEPVIKHIGKWLDMHGIEGAFQINSYNQLFQGLISCANGNDAKYDLIFLLIRFEDWLRYDSDQNVESLGNIDEYFGELCRVLDTINIKTHVFLLPFHKEKHKPEMAAHIEKIYQKWRKYISDRGDCGLTDFEALCWPQNNADIINEIGEKEAHVPYSDRFYGWIGTNIARRVVAYHASSRFKVIVLDCDDTLWGGSCGELGPSGIKLTQKHLKLQRFLKSKKHEGFLLALCSKNIPSDVINVFTQNNEMVLTAEDFVSCEINWEKKSTNIAKIAKKLNLSADSMIFIDNSLIECVEMMSCCPEVLTLLIPEELPESDVFYENIWAFDRDLITSEDKNRTALYLSEEKRKEWGRESSVENFIKSLHIEVTLRVMDDDDIQRAAQLLCRTNQFNNKALIRNAQALKDLHKYKNTKAYVVEIKDRFGMYGIVGLLIGTVSDTKYVVDTFLLSCRVLGRKIEEVILCQIREMCKQNGCNSVILLATVTDRNKPFMDFISRTGWINKGKDGERLSYEISSDHLPERIDEITVVHNVRSEEFHRCAAVNAVAFPSDEKYIQPSPKSGENAKVMLYFDQFFSIVDKIANLKYKAYYQTFKELLQPNASSLAGYESLRETFCALWKRVLAMDSIQEDANFFSIGGNSFQAVELVSLYRKKNIKMSLDEFFRCPTISKQIALAEHKSLQKYEDPNLVKLPNDKGCWQIMQAIALQADNVKEVCRATAMQRDMFDMYCADPKAYLRVFEYELKGDLDVKLLEESLNELVERHDILRTVFHRSPDFSEVFQVVFKKTRKKVFFEDISELNGEDQQKYVEFYKRNDRKRGFDLSKEPALRFTIIKRGDKHHTLIWLDSYLTTDALSIHIMKSDLFGAYQRLSRGTKGDVAETNSFGSYVRWIERKNHEEAGLYWRNYVMSGGKAIERFEIDYEYLRDNYIEKKDERLEATVENVAKNIAISKSVFYQAVCGICVAILRNKEDFVFGLMSQTRTHEIDFCQETLGLYINFLPIRVQLNDGESFASVTRSLYRDSVDRAQYSWFEYGKIREILGVGDENMFDMLFVTRNLPFKKINIDDLPFSVKYLKDNSNISTYFDLNVCISDNSYELIYNKRRYEEKQIIETIRFLVSLEKEVLKNPEITIGELKHALQLPHNHV